MSFVLVLGFAMAFQVTYMSCDCHIAVVTAFYYFQSYSNLCFACTHMYKGALKHSLYRTTVQFASVAINTISIYSVY